MTTSATSEPRTEMLDPHTTSGEKQRVYEIGYLLSPAIRDEAVSVEASTLKKIISDHQGEMIAEGEPDYIDLAYPIVKVIDNAKETFEQGYFGWMKFSVTPSQILAIKEIFDRSVTVIRYLLITTVRENTVLSKKPLSKILRKEKREKNDVAGEGEVTVPEVATVEDAGAPEKIDASIDVAIDTLVEGDTKE